MKPFITTLLLTAALSSSGTAGAQTARSAETVTIASGAVHGSTTAGVTAWKGIPFAAPPVGANRWREPQRAKTWSGVRETTQYGHDCMQKPFPSDAAPLGTEPAEDCLVLNVWKPAGAPTGKKLPVMVWIYGGGFVNGGSSPSVYDGRHFAEQGIIFVSFNYRLGRFGFFAHPALTAAHEGLLGNYGYMDQIAALKWVKRNIGAFGGDPANVTLFGESAGGGSTLTLLTSPVARGLFARVAVMSGGGRSALLPPRKISLDQPGVPSAESIGVNFAKTVGIEGSGADALAKLRALSADQVLQGLSMMALFVPQAGPVTYVGGPVEDGTIVTGTPQALLEAGRQAKVPVMIGTTSADIGFSFARSMDELLKPFGDRVAKARALYDPAATGDARAVGTAIGMDRGMTEPARYVSSMIAKAGQPSYRYRFSYVAQTMRGEWKTGAPHATDIPWVFDTVDAKYGDKLTAEDKATARAANLYFGNYAKTGDPNGRGLPAWRPVTPTHDFLLDFTADNGPVGGADPWAARLDLIADSSPPAPPR